MDGQADVGLPAVQSESRRKTMRYVIARTTAPALSAMDPFFSDFFGASPKKIPPVDVYETAAAYTIEADIAGYDQADLSLSVKGGVLTLSSSETWKEKRARRKAERNAVVSEISLPDFSRSFQLPEDADSASISAESRDGVLTVTIPRLKRAGNGHIEISIGK